MNRRDLLAALAATASSSMVAGRVWAAPKADGRMLVVFLRGAYDAQNVVIPTGSAFYYRSRPSLAIAKPDAANPQSALTLDPDWGLHPALRDTIAPLYAKGQAAFVPFAGTDDVTRSHFETQDTIELGQTVGGSRDYSSGFMARLAAQLTAREADRLHGADAADLSGSGRDPEHRDQPGRQARHRRKAGPAHPGYVRRLAACPFGRGGLPGPGRRLPDDLRPCRAS